MTLGQKSVFYNFKCSLWIDEKCIEKYESDYNSWTGLRGKSKFVWKHINGHHVSQGSSCFHAFKIISGNIQVICITWSVPDLYLQPLPDRNPRVTRQDLNPKIFKRGFQKCPWFPDASILASTTIVSIYKRRANGKHQKSFNTFFLKKKWLRVSGIPRESGRGRD